MLPVECLNFRRLIFGILLPGDLPCLPHILVVPVALGALLRLRLDYGSMDDLVAYLSQLHLIEHHALMPLVRVLLLLLVVDSNGVALGSVIHLIVKCPERDRDH